MVLEEAGFPSIQGRNEIRGKIKRGYVKWGASRVEEEIAGNVRAEPKRLKHFDGSLLRNFDAIVFP